MKERTKTKAEVRNEQEEERLAARGKRGRPRRPASRKEGALEPPYLGELWGE